AMLAVYSDPSEANVLVDGTLLGRTPYQGPLQPGEHTVAVELEGRLRQQRMVFARAGRDASLSFALPPLPKAPALAVESDQVGVTPWSAEAKPGAHGVAVSGAGFVKEERTVQIHPNRDTDLAFALQRAGPARLHVDTELPATVRVDGKELGKSPLAAEVEPGEHHLEISSEGYKTVAQQLTLDAGQGLSVRIPLQRAQSQAP